jgi:hypothetical protein
MNFVVKEDSNVLESEMPCVAQIDCEEETKRGRGRPRKYPVKEENGEKKGRGRPRKYLVKQEAEVKRGRGRPRKYSILEKELLPSGLYKPAIKKVDSGHLLKQMFNYFTKLLIIHNELAKMGGRHEVVFNRLKNLDFQMAEVCKTILSREYIDSTIEEKEVA